MHYVKNITDRIKRQIRETIHCLFSVLSERPSKRSGKVVQ